VTGEAHETDQDHRAVPKSGEQIGLNDPGVVREIIDSWDRWQCGVPPLPTSYPLRHGPAGAGSQLQHEIVRTHAGPRDDRFRYGSSH